MFLEGVVGNWFKSCSFELSSTGGCWAAVDMKGIPDEWCCDVKALMTELNSGPEVCSARDVGQWNADVLEIRWTKTVDTVKSSKCYLERYSLKHRKPVKDITKDRSDVVKLAGTNNQTVGGVKHHLQMACMWLWLICRIEWSSQITTKATARVHLSTNRLPFTSSDSCHGPPYTSKVLQLVEAAKDDVLYMLVHRQFTVNSDAEVTNFVQRRYELVFNLQCC